MTNSTSILESLAAEVAALKAQNASLEKRLAALEPKAIAEGKPLEPGTKVHTIPTGIPDDFEMPTDQEFAKLEKAVVKAFPHLIEREYEPETFSKGFKAAFVGLAAMRRLDEPQSKWYPVAYKEECETRAKRAGLFSDINWYAFIAAVVAHGDVCYATKMELGVPQYIELGLRKDDFGRPARGATWRNSLTGVFMKPGQNFPKEAKAA
ncbi:MAG: hypothetical protein AB1508_12685 [Pseudomonadota bacterium]